MLIFIFLIAATNALFIKPLDSDKFYRGSLSASNGDSFSIYAPENANEVSIYLTTYDCEMALVVATGMIPCKPNDTVGIINDCTKGDLIGTIAKGFTSYLTLNPLYFSPNRTSYGSWVSNQNFYIYVYGFDSNATCEYVLRPIVSTDCPQGTLAAYIKDTDGYVFNCTRFYTQCDINNCKIDLRHFHAYNQPELIKTILPENTAKVIVRMTSNIPKMQLSAKNYATYNFDPLTCVTTDSTYNQSTHLYDYLLECYTPASGDFYIEIRHGGYYVVVVEIEHVECPTGFTGENCQEGLMNLDIDLFQKPSIESFFIKNGSSFNFYIDVPANYYGRQMNLKINSKVGEVWTTSRHNAPIGSILGSGYDVAGSRVLAPLTLIYSEYDWALGGRIYISFDCEGGNFCFVEISTE